MGNLESMRRVGPMDAPREHAFPLPADHDGPKPVVQARGLDPRLFPLVRRTMNKKRATRR